MSKDGTKPNARMALADVMTKVFARRGMAQTRAGENATLTASGKKPKLSEIVERNNRRRGGGS